MVDVQGTVGAIGHMGPPYATSLIDLSHPAHPRILARIPVRPGTHSHKARICGNTLAINVERYGGRGGGSVGLALYDISDVRFPKERSFFRMGGLSSGGSGVHRFQFDCARKLIYASGSADGYRDNITMLIDVADPDRPREIGRWGASGQRITDSGDGLAIEGLRTHHPLRHRNRLYVSLWYGGFAILDITDLTKPTLVSHVNYHHGAGGGPTHTALPVGHRILGKKWLVVFDEELGGGEPPAFMRIFDITDETRPVQASVFQVPFVGKKGSRFGAHQPHEQVGRDNLIYGAWFAGGLRVVDISNPYRPREAGHYIPQPKGGRPAESNDVFVDSRGFIYLLDRLRGLDILRFAPPR